MTNILVTVTVDRPLGSVHPSYPNITYPLNYGFVKGITGGDGEEQDAYILGVDEPIDEFCGKLLAIIKRHNDVEEKWVVCPIDQTYTEAEIISMTYFQERFFDISVKMEPRD